MNTVHDNDRLVKVDLNLLASFIETFPKCLSNIEPLNFSVPNGWIHIVYNLLVFLESKRVPIFQIKQKFGKLVVHPESEFMHKLTDETQADIWCVIQDTEEKALNMCEKCGKIGATRNSQGYVENLCKECRV